MRDQIRHLKSAIEKLVNTTRGDEHSELLDAIFDVAEVAGIDAQRPMQSNNIQPRPKRLTENSPILMSPAHGEDITINATTGDFISKASSQASSHSSSLAPLAASSQRLTCGIWLDHLHYMRVSIPPDDIIPYLGPGSKTFAGILFWSMMDHSQKKCMRKHSEPTDLIRRGLGHSNVTEGWAITYIQAMIEARQEYKRTGSISAQYASAAEPDLGMVVQERINADYKARGIDPNRWLSTMGIEKRVRGMVGEDAFAVLETAARGGGEPALRYLLETIKCNLAETGICFGDGPRWSVDIVDGLFLDWVHRPSRVLFDGAG
ncbi:hypothetical protein DL768_010437 [Monosporascus sp. mg162]|nr:hypothetical protein DL768_010437 [Monosporascus sp. mg162]